ncbi:GNAT family N-acetyltransferase [Paenibacillus sp. sptzw28]|uniref:GNAT family N-acetyltransferase n=1 Tax=Paenibacillus sp. sptzw28 TaxID=715179 RepID=UPI001C6EDD72|nr:GNAT family N-acetyltransferase [Paenibacillus sp. sptzw28]QYR22808.1 GNAT family N-acetyltransferase [Paenibacillus sp. sptzw28]
MELRNLRPDEFDINLELSMYAFQFSLPAEQLEKSRARFKPERVWGVFEDGKLEAQLTLIPFQMYVQGRAIAMGGIAGVATWPEHRRRGHVELLLRHSLRRMRENGQSISCLHPFSFGFYRKFGWETYTDYKKYTVETTLFPPRVAVDGNVVRMGEYDIQLLSRIYENYASGYNGTLARDEDWWRNSVLRSKEGNIAVYYRPDGAAAGYILYKVAQRVMTIHEMVYEDEQARQGLWTYIANHDSMVDKAVLNAPLDDPLPYLLPNPRIGQEIVPYFMARIVDTEEFIRQYQFNEADSERRIILQLSDPYAPWNEGIWSLSAAGDGSGRLERLQDDEEHPVDLVCDINTWTALLMGYRRPAQLHGLGRLGGSSEAAALLETLIRPRQTYLMDFF